MVRKITFLLLVLAAMVAQPMAASAAEVYSGNIPTEYVEIAQRLVPKKLGFGEYVFYRSGVDEYTLITGDIEWDGAFFSAETATCYRIYNAADMEIPGCQFFSEAVEAWELHPGSFLVYSSLSDYPELFTPEAYFSLAAFAALVIGTLLYLLRSIFGFNLRRR